MRLPSILLWSMAGALGAVVGWAARSVIDESSRAGGTVIASSRVQVIQSVDGGVLEQLRVHEGDRVRKGDVLAVFDETRTRASLQETEAKRTSQRATLTRLEAELGDAEPQFQPELTKRFPVVVQVQHSLYRERRKGLAAELQALADVARLARDELAMVERLVASGDASQVELLRARRAVSEAESAAANPRNQYIQDVSAQLTKVRADFEHVEQQGTQKSQQLGNSGLD